MRRKQVFKRGRIFSLVVAGFAGYVLGGWNWPVQGNHELSAAQTVALRFPQDTDDTPVSKAVSAATANVIAVANARLLSPEPMVPKATPQPGTQAAAPQAAIPASALQAQAPQAQPAVQLASVEVSAPALPAPAAAARPAEIKPVAVVHHRDERPGFVLNDAQIASIKERLHLTQDQEQMWPAVEAALRNLAYARTREARRRGVPANAVQIASADPNGTDVQGLKSAAIPLIMSFNEEQKDEVRNLAHVMGLDQLATQF